MSKRALRIELAYDGKHYHGWQIQPKTPTVQSEINRALSAILKTETRVKGAGRTDAKAHAIRYTAHFHTENQSIPPHKFPLALNALLPEDIRVIACNETSTDFDAQFSATAREYVYHIIDREPQLPHFRDYAHFTQSDLDIGRLREVAELFRGRHNFKHFTVGYNRDNPMPHPERRIDYLRVKRINNHVFFFIKGEGFLRGMIRAIIAVCLSNHDGKLSVETIRQALNGEDSIPQSLKVAVPACGLYFKRAYYR